MKENKYDDPAFFEAYSHFPRSVQGLSAAGEWETFRKMLPELKGARVLDLGCGMGWHLRYAMGQGADLGVGCDLSERMLAAARERTADPRVTFLRAAIEDVNFPPGSFDLVISSLALHYVEDFAPVCEKVYGLLKSGGSFVLSVEHPVFTAQGKQDWCRGEDGAIRHWPVDDYFLEGKRETMFLGQPVIKYHKTLTTYAAGLLCAGFILTGLAEPQPSPELIKEFPGMAQESRRPMMLILSARKP